MGLLKKLFGTNSEREIRKINPIVDRVLSYDNEYQKLSDSELQEKTVEFKKRYRDGESLDDLLPEAFATVREASYRVLGMKHFPVQIIGGIILHQGRIAEMKTGEGKTLVATLPAYLNALTGKGVYIVTVNDYLAKRDSQWMGKVYNFLGLTTGVILHEKLKTERKEAYNCDITYGTNNEIGFDYLRDNMAYKLDEMVQRGFNYAIVDEVDSVLIDEARTPLIISGFSGETSEGYQKADEFVRTLRCKKLVEIDTGSKLQQMENQLRGVDISEDFSDYDYVVEEKNKTATLTDRGVKKAEEFYGLNNLSDSENVEILHYITRSLKAYGIFKRDVDYVIKDGKVVIVDESTGRLMDGRRYNEGVHQAIEAKEGVDIQKESKTLASITFQNLFRKFPKLSGMTGTAKTEEEEFANIYNLDVIEIPTNKPICRIDKPDKVYITRKAKLNAIVKVVVNCYTNGQPILVGTASVERSEELSNILKEYQIPHTVLNAKYHEQEAKIVAQAGKKGSVTIATNMAGRGTDIILGGNAEYLVLEELRNEGYSEELINEADSYSNTYEEEILNIRNLYQEKLSRIRKELEPDVQEVKELGGLYILGSERHESRRIDNQLRGRSGRQGDVGVSEFMLSLEDDLMRLFGSTKLVEMCKMMKIPEDMPIDMGILSNSVEKAQKRIEGKYFQMRKNTLEYDEVLAEQRDIIYEERYKLLSDAVNFKEVVLKMIREITETLLNSCIQVHSKLIEEEISRVEETFEKYQQVLKFFDFTVFVGKTGEELKVALISYFEDCFEKLCKTVTDEFVSDFSKRLLLFLLDQYWQDHMISMDELKQGIGLQSQGKSDPLQYYRFEAYDLFEGMLDGMREEILSTFMSLYFTNVLDRVEKIVSEEGVKVNEV